MLYPQNYILDKLIHARFLRNKDMRLPRMESNLYQYHLKRVIKDGLVVKTQNGYTLSDKGLKYADSYSDDLRDQRKQPKLVTVSIITNERSEALLLPRAKQPFIGQLNFPSGKIHDQERLEKAASREVEEKLGLKIGLEPAATVHLSLNSDDHNISESYCFVMSATISSGDKGEKGIWIGLDQLTNQPVMPGVMEIWQVLEADQQFHEITVLVGSN